MDPTATLLQEVLNGLDNGSGRFTIIDDSHIHDTHSGLKFHMYDAPKPFHITLIESDEEIAHMRDFVEYPELMKMFETIKEKLITSYKGIASDKRAKLLEIFNTPPKQ